MRHQLVRLMLLFSVAVLCGVFPATANPGVPQPTEITRMALSETGQAGSEATESAPVQVPPPSEQAIAYYRSGIVLWLVDLAWGLLLMAALLFSGFSARLRDWAGRIGRRWFFVVGVYFVLFSLVTYALNLPLDFYTGFIRQHEYGLSNQTLAKWFTNSLIGLGLTLAAGVLLLWVPYLLVSKSPRRWWLYSGLLSLPLLTLLLLISPIWIDPLFNKFGPMQDRALETRILQLAERAGIEGSRVFEVDKSVDTKAVNAYVTGLGGSARIVLWDTLLGKLDTREVLYVMGHEMGHYVLGHVTTGILLGTTGILTLFFLVHKTADGLIARFKDRFGFDHLGDVASLPLILLLFNIYAFLLNPLLLAHSRYQEHEADRFGLELTRDNRAAATAFVKLQTENLSVPYPDPIIKFLRSTHPPIGERIEFMNTYKPWATGAPLTYGHLFK